MTEVQIEDTPQAHSANPPDGLRPGLYGTAATGSIHVLSGGLRRREGDYFTESDFMDSPALPSSSEYFLPEK